jgi:hypothetical protein
MKFLFAFLVVLIAGTLGVYYGIQPLWRAIGWPIPPAPPGATAPKGQPAPATSEPPIRSLLTRQPESTAATASATTPKAESTPATDDTLGTEPPPATATQPVDAPPPAAPTVPSITLPPSAPGSKGWGLTITSAAYYSLSGELRGHLAGGTVMDIDDGRSTEKGVEMSLGQVERSGTMAGPYLVANADLVRFQVARSEVPANSLATLKQYYQLKGQLEQRLNDLKKQAISAHPNPYAAAYGEAVQQYNAFGDRQIRLTAQRDKAAGTDRMRYIDTLRGMITEGKQLELKLQEAKGQYNQWKAAHPNAVPPDLAASDAQVQAWRQQLAALEPAVKEITQ